MYLRYHELSARLTTKPVVFEATYYAQDSGTLEQLRELSSRRKAWEEARNGVNMAHAIAREIAGGETSPVAQELGKVEKYLPLLENLVTRVLPEQTNPLVLKWTEELKLRWTSPVSGGFTKGKLFRVNHLVYEHTMVMWLYAGLLRERAFEMIDKGDLVEASNIFRKAAGVFQHLEGQVLPTFQTMLPPERPPEVTTSMAKIWGILCLAEAQAVAARKAAEKQSSGGLLAKLHYGVVELLSQAAGLLRERLGDWNETSDKFRRWLGLNAILHETQCYRIMAEDYRKQEKTGMAVALMRVAQGKLLQTKPPGSALSSAEDVWKALFKQEVDAVALALKKYLHENEFVFQQKVPDSKYDLPHLEGKTIVSAIAFQPSGLDRHFIFVETNEKRNPRSPKV